MKPTDKEAIAILRGQGLGYGSIAARLNIPESTVKAYCRRNGLAGHAGQAPAAHCPHCGGAIEKNEKHKPKKFCSDACRLAWWNSHLGLVKRKAYYEIICAHCGTVFQSYGNKGRKYCRHDCYVADRFGRSQGT